MTVPVFVNVLGGGLVAKGKIRETYASAGQTISISVLVLLFAGAIWLVKGLMTGGFPRTYLPPARRHGRAALVFIYINLVAFFIGQVLSADIRAAPFILQTMLPVIAIFVTFRVVRTYDDILRLLTGAFAGVLVGLSLVLVINVLALGVGLLGASWVDNYQGFGIYQLDAYVPNIFATFAPIGVVLALLARSRGPRYAYVGGLGLMFLVIFHLTSITALLIALSGIAVLMYLGLVNRVWRPRALHLLLASGLVVGPLVLWNYAPSTAEAVYKLGDARTKEGEGGVGRRMAWYGEVGADVTASPLWGKAYRSDYLSDLGGLVGNRVAKPHNQYLDIAVKAGIPGLFAFLFLILTPIVRCRRGYLLATDYRERMVGIALVSALIPTIVFHNFTVVPYGQPYSGPVLFMLGAVAYAFRSCVKRQDEPGQRKRPANVFLPQRV